MTRARGRLLPIAIAHRDIAPMLPGRASAIAGAVHAPLRPPPNDPEASDVTAPGGARRPGDPGGTRNQKELADMIRRAAVTGLAVLTALAAGAGAAKEYGEAPELRALVEAGHLPPVAERLPDEPVVVEPLESVGRYGGVWRAGDARGADEAYINFVGYEPIVRFTTAGELVPNLVASVDVSEDAQEYVLHLRPGMRWSDGAPFSSADFQFWYDSVLKDQRITPTTPDWLTPGGHLGQIEAVDDYTVRITFDVPHGLFLLQAGLWTSVDVPVPAHYMRQFHIDHADEAELEAKIAGAGLQHWTELWDLRQNPLLNTERPVLRPWVLVRPFGEGIDHVVYERNPYYWKVDPEGNQLPYLDRVEFRLVQDVQVLNLLALDGAFDWQFKDVVPLEQLALFTDNQERGDYRLINVTPVVTAFAAYYFNLSHRDDYLRELFHDDRFRKALSVAIDREEIIDLVHFGMTTPRQPAPWPDTPFYDPEFETAWTQFDPDLANRMLDEIGLTERNADRMRLGPDGTPIRLILHVPAGRQARIDATEMVANYWTENVGIQSTFRVNSRDLHQERRLARDFEVWVWSGASGTVKDAFADPSMYLPYNLDVNSAWALDYAEWKLSGGASGREPTHDIRRAMDLFDEILATGNPERQNELMREIITIARENLWIIGIAGRPPEFSIAKNGLRNVPLEYVESQESPGIFHPETWYWEN